MPFDATGRSNWCSTVHGTSYICPRFRDTYIRSGCCQVTAKSSLHARTREFTRENCVTIATWVASFPHATYPFRMNPSVHYLLMFVTELVLQHYVESACPPDKGEIIEIVAVYICAYIWTQLWMSRTNSLLEQGKVINKLILYMVNFMFYVCIKIQVLCMYQDPKLGD